MPAEQSTDVEEQESTNEEETKGKADVDLDEGRLGEQIDPEERFGDDETVSDNATCPECGEPVHNLRMTCPMCGHEYKDKEYDDDAGTEFRAGSEIDDDEVGEQVKETEGKAKTHASEDSDDDGDDDTD